MNNQTGVFLLLLLSFVGGSIYNFRIRKQCIYNIRLKRSTIITLIIGSIVINLIAYIGGNTWDNYLFSIAGSLFLISGVTSEGIHERGTYYSYGRGILVRLAKWQEIKDIKFDKNKNKLVSFKLKTLTVFTNQHYSSEDIDKINEYLENM